MNEPIVMRALVAKIIVLLFLFGLAVGANAAEEEEPVEIGYYAFKPSIVSNLSGGPKYIRCDIQLMTEQASLIPQIELHAPALRHHILMLIAGQDGKRLKTREGKEGLRQEAFVRVNAVVHPGHDGGVGHAKADRVPPRHQRGPGG